MLLLLKASTLPKSRIHALDYMPVQVTCSASPISAHAGLVLYVAYAILQCAVLQPEPYYSVYDSSNWAKARWFLLKRLGLSAGQSRYFTPGSGYAIFNSTTIANNPGGPNRWRLSQDSSGWFKCSWLHQHC